MLDPLDGTKDFIQGTSNYAMHLSLNYRQKPHLGIVLIPEKDELWISNGEEVKLKRPELAGGDDSNLLDANVENVKKESKKKYSILI